MQHRVSKPVYMRVLVLAKNKRRLIMEYSPVPNQRRVTIHKVDQPQFYTKIDPASCKQAMGSLHYSTFKLYMYFCLNATNFVLFPTPLVFCDEISLPRNTYYAAFDELLKKAILSPSLASLVCSTSTRTLVCIPRIRPVPKPGHSTPETRKARTKNQRRIHIKQ